MNTEQPQKEKYSAPAVTKTLDLIELLAKRNDELSINEIARLINSPVNSVYRICLELEKRGYMTKNFHTGLYQLGVGFHFIGQAALNKIDMRNNALPIMQDIRDKFNETVHLCIMRENKLIVLDQIETIQPIRIHVDSGTTLHPHASAFGKVILAHLGEERLEYYFGGQLERLTANTIIDVGDLKAQLNEIRKTNIAYDWEEYMEGAVCAGSAIFDVTDNVVASIGIVGPRYRIKDSKLIDISEYIKRRAKILSKSLGFSRLTIPSANYQE